MPMLVAGLLLLWLSSILLRGFMRGNPAAMSRQLRKGGGWLAIAFALFMLVRGEFNVAFGAAMFGTWLLGTRPGWLKSPFANAGSTGWAGPRRGGRRSEVRTAALAMTLDQTTGHVDGSVLVGPLAGRVLNDLSQAECLDLYRWCRNADPPGVRLLETYFDRRFAGWREAGDTRDDASRSAPRRGTTQMSEREAHEVLGLAQGASREEVTRAHRELMKRVHPDHGGTTDMAARVNAAKDVLMRHP